MSGEGSAIVVRTVGQWKEQASLAVARIVTRNGGKDPGSLRASHDVDPEAFRLLIEALCALAENGLSPMPDLELRRLAGVAPAAEVLECP
ncbi:hypothetical protein [Streptomyces werraensis]|uniref:hypothetical protein n=1 Tax=Streptomyces werraensis TaxID=68284 RepID=UPI003423FCB1